MPNSTADQAPAGAPQKRRAAGPFRTGAIVPLAIIAALCWCYFHFFFDGHLRRGFEYLGTQVMGAEVDVGAVETSFWNATLAVRDIQATDAEQPTRNLFQIGTVSFGMLWDGLLRGKVVIDHAEVLEIQVLSPRARAGYVVPVDPEAESSTDKLLGNVKRRFDGNVLGDLAAMAQGSDAATQLGALKQDLKSSARAAQLQKELAQKEQEWKTRLATLPKSEQYQALEQRLRQVKRDRFKDAQEVQASLKELEAIRDALDGHVKNVQGTSQALGSEVNGYKNIYAELDQAVKQDVADLQAHFRIPAMDTQTLADLLFGPEMFAKVANARRYMDQARDYMPPQRSAEEKAALRLQPHARGEGRDYAFGRPQAYPLFWLKRATISSHSGSGPYAGDLKGEILDVASDPALVGRPAILRVQGDFPGQSIYDTKLELTVDHTGATPVERMEARVGRYPVTGRALVQGDEVSLGFAKAEGRTQFNAELSGDRVELRAVNDFTQLGYQVTAKSPVAQELIAGAVNGVQAVNMTARVNGTWSKLDWYLQTNLGDALAQGFRRQLQAKIEAARARIQAMVNERIAAERKKLQDQYAAADASVKRQLAASQAELEKVRAQWDAAKAQLEKQKTQLVKTQEKKLQEQGNKLLQDALKRK